MPKRSPFDIKKKSSQDVEREKQDKALEEQEKKLGVMAMLPKES